MRAAREAGESEVGERGREQASLAGELERVSAEISRLAGEGRIHLHRDHHAIRWQGRGQRQSGVTVAGADFQDAMGPAFERQRLEQGRDVGQRHPTILTWPTTPR